MPHQAAPAGAGAGAVAHVSVPKHRISKRKADNRQALPKPWKGPRLTTRLGSHGVAGPVRSRGGHRNGDPAEAPKAAHQAVTDGREPKADGRTKGGVAGVPPGLKGRGGLSGMRRRRAASN